MSEDWRRARGIEGDAIALTRHRALAAEVQRHVATTSAEISRPAQIRKFIILPYARSKAAGEVTASHTLRRDVVAQGHADAIDPLHQETA